MRKNKKDKTPDSQSEKSDVFLNPKSVNVLNK